MTHRGGRAPEDAAAGAVGGEVEGRREVMVKAVDRFAEPLGRDEAVFRRERIGDGGGPAGRLEGAEDRLLVGRAAADVFHQYPPEVKAPPLGVPMRNVDRARLMKLERKARPLQRSEQRKPEKVSGTNGTVAIDGARTVSIDAIRDL